MRWPLFFLCAAGILAACPRTAFSESIRIEAEDMTSYSDRGGLSIYAHACPAASEGMAVDGLDVVGEWIEIPFEIPAGICFVDSLRSAAYVGAVRTFSIAIESASSGVVWALDELVTPPGSGITWTGATYDWVQSTTIRCLPAGSYAMIITRLGEECTTRLDCIDLVLRNSVSVPTVPTTWGRIKTLYLPKGR